MNRRWLYAGLAALLFCACSPSAEADKERREKLASKVESRIHPMVTRNLHGKNAADTQIQHVKWLKKRKPGKYGDEGTNYPEMYPNGHFTQVSGVWVEDGLLMRAEFSNLPPRREPPKQRNEP